MTRNGGYFIIIALCVRICVAYICRIMDGNVAMCIILVSILYIILLLINFSLRYSYVYI